ncbi:AraC family transcriptional regulator [Dyella sp.]|uniref:AraC family transcriptional regulator n=1 Tax=Dyella sp. TaxID=1869338 RepID=UPI002ED562D9
MTDPLAEIVSLLQPSARHSKLVRSSSPWRIRRTDAGQLFYGVILEGGSRLAVDGQPAVVLQAGDFILIPASHGFVMSSLDPATTEQIQSVPVEVRRGEYRLGPEDVPVDTVTLVGHCAFSSPDAGLLVSLLPQLIHIRGDHRLASLVKLVSDESRERRPAREEILARLLEVMMIEALRVTAGASVTPGLLRGLADERLAVAIRRMHEDPSRTWTVAQLAREAALSRSAFFERFNRTVGVAPMEYLLTWRMALAKHLLRQKEGGIAEVAERVGYSSASTFSVAFARHAGMPPTRYAREQEEAALRS